MDDIERGEKYILQNVTKPQEHNFFDIARSFKSYQSIDIGQKCEQSRRPPCDGLELTKI